MPHHQLWSCAAARFAKEYQDAKGLRYGLEPQSSIEFWRIREAVESKTWWPHILLERLLKELKYIYIYIYLELAKYRSTIDGLSILWSFHCTPSDTCDIGTFQLWGLPFGPESRCNFQNCFASSESLQESPCVSCSVSPLMAPVKLVSWTSKSPYSVRALTGLRFHHDHDGSGSRWLAHQGPVGRNGSKRIASSLRQQDFNVPGQGLIINFIHHWFPSLLRRDRTPDELENWIGRFQLLKGSLWLMVQYFRLLVEVGYNSVCIYIYRFIYAIIYIYIYMYVYYIYMYVYYIYTCIYYIYIYV